MALDAVGMNITAGAAHLGVSRNSLSRVINGLAGVSPEMAIRLDKAFGGGAEIWVRMQANYDFAKAKERAGKIKVRKITSVVHA